MSRHLPSHKTINAKVKAAIAAVDSGRYATIATKHVVADMEELGLESEDDYWDAIYGFLVEIQQEGPAQSYAGGRPPHRCYEPGFEGLELFAFAWKSRSAGCRMYLKFAIRKDYYCHLDCHPDRHK